MTLFDAADLQAVSDRTGARLAKATARTRPWSRLASLGLVSAVVAAASVAFARWQLDLAVVPWDSKNHFYPMFRFLGDALRQGTLPLWNPYHFGGYPAVADPQSLIFTPSMALLAFLVPNTSMPAFDAIIFGHLTIGGLGVLGLARRWTWHPAAALLAALVFMFGGSAAARLQHTGMIISYAFFPLALWALLAAMDRRSFRLAVVAGGLAALMALGRDQVAYLLCVALAGSALCQAVRSDSVIRYARTSAPIVLLAGIVTLAIIAVPALLTIQFLHSSNRPGIAYGMALEGSLDPVNLLTLIAPNAFGSLDKVYDYWGPGAATLAGNDWTDRSIDYLFAGTLSAVLILWHALAGGRLFERGSRFFALLTILPLLYAFGRYTAFFGAAFDWVPGVSLYRRPADATFVANIGLAFLSGQLLHRFVVEGLPRAIDRKWALLAGVVAIIATAFLVGSSLSFARQAGHLGGSVRNLLGSVGVAGVVAGALYVGRRPRWRGYAAFLLVGATAAQLLWLNADSPLNAEPASTYSAYNGLYPDQARGLAVLQRDLGARAAQGEHPRLEILGLDGSWQNASMVFKLENTVGYNPLRIADYEHAVGVSESSVDPKFRVFPETFRGYNSRLASLLGLHYLVLDRPVGDLPRHIPRPRGTLLFAGDHFYAYALERPAAPRVYVATHIIATDNTLDAFDVGHEALIDRADLRLLRDQSLTGSADTVGVSRATIEHYEDNRITVDVDAAASGVLVLHDLAYAGWQADVDGVQAPILRTNLLFRGVEVPAGHHTVQFSFHPLSLANLTAAARGFLREGKP